MRDGESVKSGICRVSFFPEWVYCGDITEHLCGVVLGQLELVKFSE